MALNFFIKKSQKKMTQKILNLIFPQTCTICGNKGEYYLCKNCQKRMKKQTNKNISKIQYENCEKLKCYFELLYIFEYKNLIRKLMLQYKFGKKAYISDLFSNIILKDENYCRKLNFYDIIVPVPMYYKKKQQRGYNQTELIANILASSLKITLECNCLIKIKNTKVQSKQSKKDRKENIKNAFLVNNKEKIKNKNIILFDDIYTTGSTAKEIVRLLNNARCKKYFSFSNCKRLNGGIMEDLVESILDYVRADYTDYAIMINGEWGSGKTYFWNHKIKNKIESLQLNGKKYTTIYMSLYGISNLEDISKKIFIETTQLMDKNMRKYMETHDRTSIPEYAKTGLDMAHFFGVSQNGDKMDYASFFATDDKVLCFDDLERANVDVIDILGYINNFVEHDHIKTIIICNEKELSTKLKSSNLEMKTFIATYLLDKEGNLLKADKPMVEKIREKIEYVFDKANDYERIKEKLIGETFEYAPKFNYIINGLLMRYESNEDLMRFLREHTSLITNTFIKSGTRNLRILKHALNDFKKVYENVNKFYPNTNLRVLQTMLIFTIAVSFEIKAGKITKDKFVNINSNEEYKAILVSSRVLMDNRQFYIKEFDNNYYFNFKADYRFFKFIEIYVRTRIFDMKSFKKDMEMIIKTIDTEKLPGYKRLLTEEYWKISDDKFPGIIEEIVQNVKNGDLKLIEIVKLFAYFSYFSKRGLIEYDIQTIKKIFLEGMDLAAEKSEYCDNIDEELSRIGIDVGEEMDEILRHFHTLNKELEEKMYRKQAEDIFRCIPMKMELFYDKFVAECMDKPILNYYDAYQMFQRITCASNEDIVMIKEMLIDRAQKHKDELEPELKFMKRLKQTLEDYCRGKDIGIKTVMLKEFSNDLDTIINMYNDSNYDDYDIDPDSVSASIDAL